MTAVLWRWWCYPLWACHREAISAEAHFLVSLFKAGLLGGWLGCRSLAGSPQMLASWRPAPGPLLLRKRHLKWRFRRWWRQLCWAAYGFCLVLRLSLLASLDRRPDGVLRRRSFCSSSGLALGFSSCSSPRLGARCPARRGGVRFARWLACVLAARWSARWFLGVLAAASESTSRDESSSCRLH